MGFFCCCYYLVVFGRFFCNTTIWSWTYARKGALTRWWKISQSCFNVLYFERQYVTLCFVLNSRSCRTEVMHRLLPVGSNNMQSLYNLFSEPLCRYKVISGCNKYGFSQCQMCHGVPTATYMYTFYMQGTCVCFLYKWVYQDFGSENV